VDIQNYEEVKSQMHITQENRRDSYEQVLLTLNARQKKVLEILTEWDDLTAQEVAMVLNMSGVTPTDERNFAAPRLTELCDKGLVRAVGKKVCDKTGRTVTIWSANCEIVQSKTAPSEPQYQFEMVAWLNSLERGGRKKRVSAAGQMSLRV
jgi:hypothetical protein